MPVAASLLPTNRVPKGIAKLFDLDCKSGDFAQSGRHLAGIAVPQAEGIGSGMTVGDVEVGSGAGGRWC